MENSSYQIHQLIIINPKHHKIVITVNAIMGVLAILLVAFSLISKYSETVNNFLQSTAAISRPIYYGFIAFILLMLIITSIIKKKSTAKQLKNLTIDNGSITLSGGAETKQFNKTMIKEITPYCQEQKRRKHPILDTAVGIKINLHDDPLVYNLILDINKTENIEKIMADLREKRYTLTKDINQIKARFEAIKASDKKLDFVRKFGTILFILIIVLLFAYVIYIRFLV